MSTQTKDHPSRFEEYKHRHQHDSRGGCPFHDAIARFEIIPEIMKQSNDKRVDKLVATLSDLLCDEQLVDVIAALFLGLEATTRQAMEFNEQEDSSVE